MRRSFLLNKLGRLLNIEYNCQISGVTWVCEAEIDKNSSFPLARADVSGWVRLRLQAAKGSDML